MKNDNNRRLGGPNMFDIDKAIAEPNWKSFNEKEEARLLLFSILRKKTPTPSNESSRLFNAMGKTPFSSYPKRCKTDGLKFKHLSKLFLDSQIKKKMFIEFSDVLRLPESASVGEIIEKKLLRSIKW